MADQHAKLDLVPRFEGYELPAFLDANEICALMYGKVAKGKILRWFRTGQLHGFKPGRRWVIRASQFVEDIEVLEQGGTPEFAPANAIRSARMGRRPSRASAQATRGAN